MRTTAEILTAGADVLDRGRWARHVTRSGRARCVETAVMDGGRQINATPAETSAALRVLAGHLGVGAASLWNDNGARSKDNVVATLRLVAARELEAQAGLAARRNAPPPPAPTAEALAVPVGVAAVPQAPDAPLLHPKVAALLSDVIATVENHGDRIAAIEAMLGADIVRGAEYSLGGKP